MIVQIGNKLGCAAARRIKTALLEKCFLNNFSTDVLFLQFKCSVVFIMMSKMPVITNKVHKLTCLKVTFCGQHVFVFET